MALALGVEVFIRIRIYHSTTNELPSGWLVVNLSRRLLAAFLVLAHRMPS